MGRQQQRGFQVFTTPTATITATKPAFQQPHHCFFYCLHAAKGHHTLMDMVHKKSSFAPHLLGEVLGFVHYA